MAGPQASTAIPHTGSAPTQTSNGGLFGSPPEPFDGDRTKAQAFFRSFVRYWKLNTDKTVVTEPYRRVALFLSYLKGPKVEDWADAQQKKMDDNVTNGRAKTSERHWTEFKDAFDSNFKDLGEKINAQHQLENLKMQGHDIDSYIAKFETLMGLAGYKKDEVGTLTLFKKGLPFGLNVRIVSNTTPVPANLEEWVKAAREQQLKWLQIQEITGKRPLNPKHVAIANALKAKGHGNQGYQKRHPDAMDVDLGQTATGATRAYPKLSPEERKRLRENGGCFRCRQIGHFSTNCPLGRTEKPAPTVKAQGEPPQKEKLTREEIQALLQDEGTRQELFDEIVDSGFA